MRSRLLPAIAVCLSAASFVPQLGFAQGALTPPGPPGPTMQTLDQLGAKSDLTNTKLGQVGAKSDLANTKLDQVKATLNSKAEKRTPISALPFTIGAPGSYYLTGQLTAGPADTAAITVNASNVSIDLNGFSLIGQGTGLGDGILIPSTAKNIRITNGSISKFGGNGLHSQGTGAYYDKLLVSENGFYGILTGDDAEVRDCVAITNNYNGIAAGHGCRVVHCIANGNRAGGISTSDECVVDSCTAAFNGSAGSGIQSGIGNIVRNCTVRANSSHGIVSFGGSQIIGNTCDANTGSGISADGNADRIDSNTLTYNGQWGIDVGATVNLVVRNSFRGNKNAPINLAHPTVYGAFIDMSSTTGPISDSTGPWSNISY